MTKLILHSDDFGLHHSINGAILDAARTGVLTSCSLMANGLAAEGALEGARKIPELGVGIHLNILRGAPLSDPETVPSLVDENGRFLNTAVKLATRSMLGRINTSEVYQEYKKQSRYIIQNGIVPTHFDSEKHSHLWLPEAAQAVKQLMAEFDIRKIRTIRETHLVKDLRKSKRNIRGSFLQQFKLMLLEYRSRKLKELWAPVKSPHCFFGVCISGRYDENNPVEILKSFLNFKQNTVIEWMFHPGYDDPVAHDEIKAEFGTYFLTSQREAETRMLLSDDFIEEIKKNKNRFISYREL